MTDISANCMLVYLTVNQATFRKLDKQATAEVTASHAAAADAGRFNKQIVDKAALEPMQKIASAARMYLYNHTLPWSDNGDRALSSANYFIVMQELSTYQHEFNQAVDEFVAEYNQHRERARLKLNSLFNPNDYPHVDEVRAKFGFSFGVMPLPTAGDFRVAMAAAEADEVRQHISAELELRTKTMMDTVWEELASTVSHLRDRLQSSGKLYESTLTNLEDLLRRLPGLNITGDAGLEQMRKAIASTMQGLTMADIKKDEQLRKAVAEQADDILRQMQGLV